MPFRLPTPASGGETVYGRKVLNSIIMLATQEINGVSGLNGRGFRKEISGNTINIDVYINVYADISCSNIAFKVQENIKRNIESMTAFKVDVINVNILGVSFRERNG